MLKVVKIGNRFYIRWFAAVNITYSAKRMMYAFFLDRILPLKHKLRQLSNQVVFRVSKSRYFPLNFTPEPFNVSRARVCIDEIITD